MLDMRLLTTILAGGLAFAASDALASGATFSPPAGCTGYLTVQSRGCRVSNHYRCTQDAPGDQWRADFDQEGMFFLSKTDRESQWIESYEMFPAVRQSLVPGPADPASFSDLLNGADSYDFRLRRSNGENSHVTGYDRLTGRSQTIDGITLAETEFDFTETGEDGTVLRRARGNEYIHRDWRQFFSGPTMWEQPDGSQLPVDGSPVEFVQPGEAGFMSTEPLFDCDAVMSGDGPAERIWRARHVR